MPGELTPDQWEEIKKGLTQIIILSTSVENINELLEKTNKKIDNIEDAQNKMSIGFALLSKTVQGNGTKKGSILYRLDCLENKNEEIKSEEKKEEIDKKTRKDLKKRDNKQLLIAVIIALLGSTVLNSVVNYFLPDKQNIQNTSQVNTP